MQCTLCNNFREWGKANRCMCITDGSGAPINNVVGGWYAVTADAIWSYILESSKLNFEYTQVHGMDTEIIYYWWTLQNRVSSFTEHKG